MPKNLGGFGSHNSSWNIIQLKMAVNNFYLVFFIYLLILAGTTYLIRVIPFTAIKEKINNRFVRSFLYYIPYAVLTAMTIPAIFYATSWWVGAAAGLLTAVIFALKGKGLTTVAIASCVAVFLVELIRF